MGRKPNAKKSQKQDVVEPSVEGTKVDRAIKSYSKKIVKKAPNAIRRSRRFQKAVVATENHCIQQIIEEMIISDSEKEDEPTDGEIPGPAMNGNTVHEKLDYIVELMQAQRRVTNESNASGNGVNLIGNGEYSGAVEVSYKSLYFDSQKKIEALMEENNLLSKKLEYANGKIKIYEKEDHVSYGMLQKVRDIFFCTNGTKAIEAGVNDSTAAVDGAVELKYARRKKGLK